MKTQKISWKIALGISALVAGAGAFSLPADAQNAVSNASMTDGTDVPASWKLGDDAKGKAILARDTAISASAPASLRLETVGQNSGSAQTTIANPPGQFTLSGTTKTSGMIESLRYDLQIFNENWAQIGWISSDESEDFKLRASSDWKQFLRAVTLPTGAKNVVFYLTVKGDGKVWLDDLSASAGDAVAPIAAPAPNQNQTQNAIFPIQNGDFSLGNATPDAWKIGDNDKTKVTLARDTTQFQSAPASLRVDSLGKNEGAAQTTVEVAGGGTFTLSGATKTRGLDGLGMILQIFGANWNQLAWNPFDLKVSGDWTPFSREIALPADARHVVVYFLVKGEGSAWLDDLSAGANVVVIAPQTQSAPQLRAFANADFSQNIENWRLTDDSKAKATLERDAAQGRGAAKIETQNAEKVAIQSELPSVPSGEITVVGQLKSAGNWNSAQVIFQSFDAAWKQLDWKQFDVDAPQNWKQFAATLSFPPGAAHVIFYLSATGRGQLWLDDLEVKAGRIAALATEKSRVAFSPDVQTQIQNSAPVKLIGAQPYKWKSAVMGGVEYATGYIWNPKNPSDLYLRADGGGIWKWNRGQNRWDALMDNLPYEWRNLQVADSFAVDPENPKTIYVAGGGSRWNAVHDVLKTEDGGKSWKRTNLKKSDGTDVMSEGNGPNRQAGERLAVDPNFPQNVWFGTRNDGLWVSHDGAKSWKNASFPSKGAKWLGISYLVFNPKSGKVGSATPEMFAGVTSGPISDDTNAPKANGGVYHSSDGGKNWTLLSGGPGANASPLRARIASDGTFYTSTAGEGGVWKWKNGVWTNITPKEAPNLSWCAIDVHPSDDQKLLASPTLGDNLPVFYSSDGGKNWIRYSTTRDNLGGNASWANYPSWEGPSNANSSFPGNTSDVIFDRFDPKTVWHASFQGPNRTLDIGEKTIVWNFEGVGREQMTTAEAVSPTQGASLISGVWDVGGFRHENLDEIPRVRMVLLESDGKPSAQAWQRAFQDCFDMDVSPQKPDAIVAAGGWEWNGTGTAALSLDNGRTFRRFAAKPFADAKFGRVAIAANDSQNIVWAPMGDDASVYHSPDGGRNWEVSSGAPVAMVNGTGPWTFFKPLCADRVNDRTFYIYDRKTGHFFVSSDGGASWNHRANLPTQPGNHYDNHKLEATPFGAGHLWLSLDEGGLLHSRDGGKNWVKMTGIERAVNFAFGKGKTAQSVALYLFGLLSVTEKVALYRSDDEGKSWSKINDQNNGLAGLTNLTGDMQKWGRVYAGTTARSVFYGEAAS